MSLEIVNEDFIMTKTPSGSWTPGTPTYTKTLSNKMTINSKKAVLNRLSWIMSGCTMPSYTFDNGNGSIDKTGSKVKADSLCPLRKTDFGLCNGQFHLTASPFTPLSCSCTFTLNNAGQTKVKGE